MAIVPIRQSELLELQHQAALGRELAEAVLACENARGPWTKDTKAMLCNIARKVKGGA